MLTILLWPQCVSDDVTAVLDFNSSPIANAIKKILWAMGSQNLVANMAIETSQIFFDMAVTENV